MAVIVRLGDYCSGHGCWPPRPNDSASPDFFVNDKEGHRLGDHWTIHCCETCHDGLQASASPDFFLNDRAAARVGDNINCGSVCAHGSPDFTLN